MLSPAPVGAVRSAEPAANSNPFTQAEIAALFAPLNESRGVLLAVSGGPDSVAMMLLAATWAETSAETSAVKLAVATVDHGLRGDSRDEAEAVAAWAASLGLAHSILTWEGEKPTARIQELARDARYDLLFQHAREIGAEHVLTAHHADDQAETILFRLLRGSGIAGLAGMPMMARHGEIIHLRPLLACSKERLLGVCAAHAHAFFRDPSNDNPSFARTRLRGLLHLLAGEGLESEAFLRLGRRAARAETALAAFTKIARGSLHVKHENGEFRASIGHLRDTPEEILLRLVAMEIEALGGKGLRLDRLESLVAGLSGALRAGAAWQGTLAGMMLLVDAHGFLTIIGEKQRRRGRGTPAASRNRAFSRADHVEGKEPPT
jgi:tRNA(Ile)-lysidine synthase